MKFYNANTDEAIQMLAGNPRLSIEQKGALIAFSMAADRLKKAFQGTDEDFTVTSHTRVTFEKAELGEQATSNLYFASGNDRNIAFQMVATFEEQAMRAHQLLPDYPIDLMLLMVAEDEEIAVLTTILKRMEEHNFKAASALVDNFPETNSTRALSIVQKVRAQQNACPNPLCPSCSLFIRLADKLEGRHKDNTPIAGIH